MLVYRDKVHLRAKKKANKNKHFIAKDIYLSEILQVAFLAVQELAIFSLHISDIQYTYTAYHLQLNKHNLALPRQISLLSIMADWKTFSVYFSFTHG